VTNANGFDAAIVRIAKGAIRTIIAAEVTDHLDSNRLIISRRAGAGARDGVRIHQRALNAG
jgi:hypothetical protein